MKRQPRFPMTMMYWPHHRPIPPGWVSRGPLPGNHGVYSILIVWRGEGEAVWP